MALSANYRFRETKCKGARLRPDCESRGFWSTVRGTQCPKLRDVPGTRACLQTMARGQNLPDFTICARPPTLVWGLAVILRSCLKRLIEITFGVCKHALVKHGVAVPKLDMRV